VASTRWESREHRGFPCPAEENVVSPSTGADRALRSNSKHPHHPPPCLVTLVVSPSLGEPSQQHSRHAARLHPIRGRPGPRAAARRAGLPPRARHGVGSSGRALRSPPRPAGRIAVSRKGEARLVHHAPGACVAARSPLRPGPPPCTADPRQEPPGAHAARACPVPCSSPPIPSRTARGYALPLPPAARRHRHVSRVLRRRSTRRHGPRWEMQTPPLSRARAHPSRACVLTQVHARTDLILPFSNSLSRGGAERIHGAMAAGICAQYSSPASRRICGADAHDVAPFG
jgi:hypothetical protein